MAGISKIIKSIEPGDDLDDEHMRDTAPQELRAQTQIAPPPAEPIRTNSRQETMGIEAGQQYPDTKNDWIKKVIGLGILIWLVALGAILFFAMNIGQNWNQFSGMQWAGVLFMVFGPALMLGVGAYALSQLSKMSNRANRLEAMIDQFSQPDRLAAERSASLAGAIAGNIDFINAKLNEAIGRTSALDEVLKVQAASIETSNQSASNASNLIGQRLEQQKDALLVISKTFDDRMEALSQMISGHGEALETATRVAEQKIKEARISVEGATAKINSASDIVRNNTVQRRPISLQVTKRSALLATSSR